MSNQRQRPIEIFDDVRGDMFSICREDFVEIYEYADRDFLEIFRGVGAFFIGNKGDPEPEIQARDKRNIGVIKRLIDHQKVNAMHELKRKESSKYAARSRWAGNRNSTTEDANACDRMRSHRIASDIDEDLDTAKAIVSKSSGGIDNRDVQRPSDCNPLSVEKAKKIIKMYIPDSIASCGIKPLLRAKLAMQVNNDDENNLFDFALSINSELHPETEEDDDEFEKIAKIFSDPLLHLLEEVSQPRKWNLALAKAYADAINPETKFQGKPIRNPDAFILARMKQVTKALKTLELHDGKAKTSLPLSLEY